MDCAMIFEKANAAGEAAVEKLVAEGGVRAMVVQGYGQNYFVADGVCGFAQVVVKPANCAFAKFLKGMGAYKGYYGGVEYSIQAYNQSMQKKEAYARAFAEVLREFDINAYSQSRMD